MLLGLRINLPYSKSILNRLLIIGALSKFSKKIPYIDACDDTLVLSQALLLAADDNHIYAGDSATAMRFLIAYLAITPGQWHLYGSPQLQKRPIAPLVTALKELGAEIVYAGSEGYLPLKIEGKPLSGGKIMIDASQSSQYTSALMLIAPHLEHGLTICPIGEIASKPYVLMTMQLMRRMGVQVHIEPNQISISKQSYSLSEIPIERDWSAAAFWYGFIAIAGKGKFFFDALTLQSIQGDAITARLFDSLGVTTISDDSGISISPKDIKKTLFEYDFKETPDLLPVLTVTCCAKQIPFRFTGISNLRIKESDRIVALMQELLKCGYSLSIHRNDVLVWDGVRIPPDTSIEINTHGDHRIAMALALLQLITPLTVLTPEVVSKSYPTFWDDFNRAMTELSKK